ncbi:MAG: phosphatidylglycerophosphatase A [Tissierellia bacterium]|nr:phosphatidylglycerophosphatase A [Tissierellia bacterium]
MYPHNMEELKEITIGKLKEKGVQLKDIAELVYDLQKPYFQGMTMELAEESVMAVLRKREVIHAILTGIAIDEMAQKKLLPEPIQSIIEADEGLYGIDEVLPLGIINLYGTIGLTNFGYLDKEKKGIIKELDGRKKHMVTTFLDDLVAAIAAAAASRIAHANIK